MKYLAPFKVFGIDVVFQRFCSFILCLNVFYFSDMPVLCFGFIFYYFRNYLYSTIPLISGSRYIGISGMYYIQFYSFVDIYYL